jgi:methionyl-tRNA formyltransferase
MIVQPKIVFFGTPQFAVASLKALVENGFDVAGVVTAPDKPAGRGRKIQQSPVKQYADQQGIQVLQPTSMKDPAFMHQLKDLNPGLQVIVAFRMLPEQVWMLPPLRTFNLHASLLPQYRGAAPINHAIINGEIKTGITTFFLKHDIDTGDIIYQETVSIDDSDDVGTLHDKLMHAGADLVVKTAREILQGKCPRMSQSEAMERNHISAENLHQAPKIFRNNCKIDWNLPGLHIHNLVRGLSPAPGAFTYLTTEDKTSKLVKIFKTAFHELDHDHTPGTCETDTKNDLNVFVNNGLLSILELQVEGKNRMPVSEFLKGNHFEKMTFN